MQRGLQLLRGPFPLGWAILLGVLALVLGGCSRGFYRRQADRDVYGLIRQKTCDPRWPLEKYTVEPDPRSRLFDPFSPDCPPMPPDDPTSHQLMQRVYHMKGWPHWHRNGDVPDVDTYRWKQYLPYNDKGEVVLNREGAVEMALLNSREYQRAQETLYLSALDVSFQRFRFDVQYFGTNDLIYTADGRISGQAISQQTLENDTDLRARKLFATGGELVVGVANSIVWQFLAPEGTNFNTLASFNLLQPLLRAGGRAVVLEALTDVERGLVADVRQMEHYRRGFYAQIVAGRAAGPGPARSGITLGALAPGGGGSASGFMGLLGDQVQIRNQRANMVSIQDSWRRLEAFNQAGRVSRFQVDQTLQSLYTSQSRLLSLVDAYEDRLEGYKITLGMPPDLPVRISDPLVARFDLIDPALTSLQDALTALVGKVRDPQQPLPAELDSQISTVLQQTAQQLAVVEKDLQALNDVLPQRDEDLRRLSGRPELQRGDVDHSAYNAEALNNRVRTVNAEASKLLPQIKQDVAGLERGPKGAPGSPDPPPKSAAWREGLLDLLTHLADRLAQLSLIQARARLDAIRLVSVDLDPQEALKTAAEHRLDWMNARAALVDVWRQIEVQANALKAGLDFTVSGSLNNTDNNPVNFHATQGRLQVGVHFDAPLTRLAERNAYREALINYERTRRDYMLFADEVYQELRTTLRTMKTSQLNFELRRAAVFLAISQVDLALLRIQEPPRPGETTQLSDTAARDILDSLGNLLAAQNTFLTDWLNYESQRISLDFDLGTMQLDGRGLWVDPGPILPNRDRADNRPPNSEQNVAPPQPPEVLPPPKGVPTAQ